MELHAPGTGGQTLLQQPSGDLLRGDAEDSGEPVLVSCSGPGTNQVGLAIAAGLREREHGGPRVDCLKGLEQLVQPGREATRVVLTDVGVGVEDVAAREVVEDAVEPGLHESVGIHAWAQLFTSAVRATRSASRAGIPRCSQTSR